MRRKMMVDFDKRQVIIGHTISKHGQSPRITIPVGGLEILNWKIGEKVESIFTKNEIITRRKKLK